MCLRRGPCAQPPRWSPRAAAVARSAGVARAGARRAGPGARATAGSWEAATAWCDRRSRCSQSLWGKRRTLRRRPRRHRCRRAPSGSQGTSRRTPPAAAEVVMAAVAGPKERAAVAVAWVVLRGARGSGAAGVAQRPRHTRSPPPPRRCRSRSGRRKRQVRRTQRTPRLRCCGAEGAQRGVTRRVPTHRSERCSIRRTPEVDQGLGFTAVQLEAVALGSGVAGETVRDALHGR